MSGFSNTEEEQTLNQLLVEMDGQFFMAKSLILKSEVFYSHLTPKGNSPLLIWHLPSSMPLPSPLHFWIILPSCCLFPSIWRSGLPFIVRPDVFLGCLSLDEFPFVGEGKGRRASVLAAFDGAGQGDAQPKTGRSCLSWGSGAIQGVPMALILFLQPSPGESPCSGRRKALPLPVFWDSF